MKLPAGWLYHAGNSRCGRNAFRYNFRDYTEIYRIGEIREECRQFSDAIKQRLESIHKIGQLSFFVGIYCIRDCINMNIYHFSDSLLSVPRFQIFLSCRMSFRIFKR